MKEPPFMRMIPGCHGNAGAEDLIEPLARIGALVLGLSLLLPAFSLAKVNAVVFVAACIFCGLALNGARFREFSVGKDSFKATGMSPSRVKNVQMDNVIPIKSNGPIPGDLAAVTGAAQSSAGIETRDVGLVRILQVDRDVKVGIAGTIASTGLPEINAESIVGIGELSDHPNAFLAFTSDGSNYMVSYTSPSAD